VAWSVFAALNLERAFSDFALDSALTEYVLVSQPAARTVSVIEVNALTRQVKRGARTLLSYGLREPSGLAVDHKRQRLFVADPKSRRVFMYNLLMGDNGLSVNENERYVAIDDAAPRWVAVDEAGTLFCTDERRSFIAEVTTQELETLPMGDSKYLRPNLHRLYTADTLREVDRPGGIAVDGNNIYWGNRARGRPFGSLLMAPEDPDSQRVRGVPGMIQSLSRNVDKVYGVCASPTAIFYTGGEKMVYGAKPGSYQTRAVASVILDDFAHPRGCVWDGDGTMYLADKGNNAVWTFPSMFAQMGKRQADKLCDVHDPYGIAVFRPSLTLDAVGFLKGKSSRALPASLLVAFALLLAVRM
jgi:sugar lactone lactonase YvrE